MIKCHFSTEPPTHTHDSPLVFCLTMRLLFGALHRSQQQQQRMRQAVALVAAAVPLAFHVRESVLDAATPVIDPIAPKQRVEKHLVLESDRARRIHTIKVSAPGLTVISAAPAAAATTTATTASNSHHRIGAVRVSADQLELLECLEVVPLEPNGLEIRFKKDVPAVTGHVLIELTLAQSADVNAVDARGGGVVVVKQDVLVTDCAHAELKLALQGHGELYVAAPDTSVNVKRLKLSVAGTGRLQFDAKAITARDDVLLQVAGAGHAHVFARESLAASTIKSSIAGSGHTVTKASDLTAHKLKSSITGYGDVKHIGAGRAHTQRVSIAGSGSVTSSAVVSDHATIRIAGSGDATLDVTESLSATCRGWGVVRYVQAPPKTLSVQSGLTLERVRAAALRAQRLDDASVRASDVPARVDAFDDISVAFDPKAERNASFDLFGAIRKVKSALSDRTVDDDESEPRRRPRRKRDSRPTESAASEQSKDEEEK